MAAIRPREPLLHPLFAAAAPPSDPPPVITDGERGGGGGESLMHAVAGGVGSALALAITYPLDQLRTFQQVDDGELSKGGAGGGGQGAGQQQPSRWGGTYAPHLLHKAQALVQRHGHGVLWRGILPMLIAMGVSNFVFFYVHSRLKTRLARLRRVGVVGGLSEQRGLQHHLGDLTVAALAGIINVLVTTPLWVASTRAKLSSHRQPEAIWAAIHRIYRDEGIQALWSGTLPSLLLVSNPTIQFFLYDLLKRSVLQIRRRRQQQAGGPAVTLAPLEAFLFGAVAKGVATVLSYPLQVAQCRLRLQEDRPPPQEGESHPQHYSGTVDCLVRLWEAKGLAGWYQGLESKLLQTITTAAFMFCMYEKIFATTRAFFKTADRVRTKSL